MNILKRYFKTINDKQVLISIKYEIDEDVLNNLENHFDFNDDIEGIRNGKFTPYLVNVELFDGENTFNDYLGSCVVSDPNELFEFVNDHGMIGEVMMQYEKSY